MVWWELETFITAFKGKEAEQQTGEPIIIFFLHLSPTLLPSPPCSRWPLAFDLSLLSSGTLRPRSALLFTVLYQAIGFCFKGNEVEQEAGLPIISTDGQASGRKWVFLHNYIVNELVGDAQSGAYNEDTTQEGAGQKLFRCYRDDGQLTQASSNSSPPTQR